MTVKELIEKLETMSQDYQVMMYAGEGSGGEFGGFDPIYAAEEESIVTDERIRREKGDYKSKDIKPEKINFVLIH